MEIRKKIRKGERQRFGKKGLERNEGKTEVRKNIKMRNEKVF